VSYVIALAQFDSSGGEPYSHLAVGGGVLATLVCGRACVSIQHYYVW